MDKSSLERFVEFLIIGIFLGVAEDVIAVVLATDAEFDLRMFGIIVAVTVPFAAFSELVVDSKDSRLTEKIAEKFKELI